MSVAACAQQVKTIANLIDISPRARDGAQLNEKIIALFASFLGTSFGYIVALRKDIRCAMLRNVFQELSERQIYITENSQHVHQSASKFDEIYDAVMRLAASTTDEVQDRIIQCYAKKIPLRCKHMITNILLELPNIGTILEIAPHNSVMFVAAALETKRASTLDGVHEVHGIPTISTWKSAHIQTIIINAINLRALTYIFIDFVHTLVKNDKAIFAVIVHGADIVINFPLAIITIPMIDDISMTVITGNEKKIVSISSVINTR